MPHVHADNVKAAHGEGYAEGYDKAEKQLHADLGRILSDPIADDRTLLDRIRTQHALWGVRIADRGWGL